MANPNAPHGFRPVRTLDGTPITTNPYTLSSSNAAIGVGDLLVWTGNGVVTRSAATPAVGTVIGVAAEAKAANDGTTILVYDNPMIVYEGQTDDGTGTSTAQTCIAANTNVVDGTPSGGVSIQELDESVATTTATLPFKILRLHPKVGNAFGEFNLLEVVINPGVMKGDGSTGL